MTQFRYVIVGGGMAARLALSKRLGSDEEFHEDDNCRSSSKS